MTSILLFCVAEEAKPVSGMLALILRCFQRLGIQLTITSKKFVRKALEVSTTTPSLSARIFYLVESRVCPQERAGFKRELNDGETFDTDFIGASVADCQAWALENQRRVNFIEGDIIAIADARSATDDTLVMFTYARDVGPPLEPGFEIPPKKRDTWYDFRVYYEQAASLFINLYYGPKDSSLHVYYERKEELTDENGVFDGARAARITMGEEPDVVGP